MQMIDIVRARCAIGTILCGHNVPEDLQKLLSASFDALLSEERGNPIDQREAIIKIEEARAALKGGDQ